MLGKLPSDQPLNSGVERGCEKSHSLAYVNGSMVSLARSREQPQGTHTGAALALLALRTSKLSSECFVSNCP